MEWNSENYYQKALNAIGLANAVGLRRIIQIAFNKLKYGDLDF